MVKAAAATPAGNVDVLVHPPSPRYGSAVQLEINMYIISTHTLKNMVTKVGGGQVPVGQWKCVRR